MTTVTRRRWLVVALALVIGAGLLLAVLHTPPARRSVLAFASGTLDDQYDVQLQAERLDYNLLTLNFELTGLSLATSGADTPFFSAGRVDVDLPWSAVTGPLMLTVVEVDQATLQLLQSADGQWNLPTSGEGEVSDTETAFALPPVGRVDLTNFGISVQAPDYDISATGVSLQLAAAGESSAALSGPLQVAQPVDIRWRDQRTTLDQLDAHLAFDGENLDLQPLEAQLPEGRLVIEGRALSLFSEPTLDLTYRTDVLLSRAATWWRPDHEVEGQAVASGSVTGPVAAPNVTADIETSGLRWAEVSDLAVRATARLEPGAFVIDHATVTHRDGSLDVTGRLALGDLPEPSQVEATWRDLDTLELVRQLNLGLPYTPAGIVSGRGVATWTEWSLDAIQVETEVTSRARPDQPRAVPVGGTARLETNSGEWLAEFEEITVPGLSVRGRVAGQLPSGALPLTDSTLEGTLNITASDLAQIAQTFALSGLVGDADTPGISGATTAEITLAGSVGSPVAEARIFDTRAGYRGLEGIDIRSTIVADGTRISLGPFEATVGPNQVAGDLQLDVEANTVAGIVNASFPDVSAFASALPEAVAPAGRLSAQITVSGNVDSPHLEAEVEGREITVRGRVLDQLTASVALDQGVLGIEMFEARQQTGFVRLQGSYKLADGTYEVALTGRELSVESLVAAAEDDASLGGQLQFNLMSSGSLSNPTGTGTARVDALEWAGRTLETADFALTLGKEGGRVDAEIPSLNAAATATVGLVGDDTSFDVTADFVRTELARVLRSTGGDAPQLDVSGYASLQLRATGDRTSLAETRIALEVRELDGFVGPTRLRLADPGSLEYAGGVVTTERLELLLDDTRLTLAGSLGNTATGRLTATLAGDLSDLEPLAAMAAGGSNGPPAAVTLSGAIDTEIVVTGSFQEPTVSSQLQVRNGSVGFEEVPSAHELEIDLSYDMQAVRIERLDGTWQGISLSGRGELPAALLGDRLPSWLAPPTIDKPVARLTLTADRITTEALAPFVDPESLGDFETGASAQLDIEADGLTLEDISGTLRFGDLDLVVAGVPFNQRRETSFELADGRLQVRAFDWGNEEDYLTLGGTIDLQGERTADLTVTAELDLRTVSAFTTDVSTEGNALLIANIQGALGDPQINGTIELTGAGLRLSDPQLIVSDLSGALLLTRDTIQLYELTGEANGGPLEISGELELVGLQPRGDVQIVGRGIAMELPEGVRTEIDTDITLGLLADEIALRGTVTVLRGAYRETLLLTGGLLAALQEQESVTIVGIDEPSPLDAITLNVRVVTAEDIIIDNNYADAAVGFDLRVVGTAASPALTGRAALVEGGQIRLGNRLYEIETGTVDFVDPTAIEPALDITARTRVSGRDITVSIAGVPDALTTEFQSYPPESESDIVSLLLTGRTLEEVGVAPQEAAAEQALGLASTEFLGTAGRSVGVDTLRVEQEVGTGQIRFDSSLVASETDPSTRLTVGKNLSDQVQLIASQDLVETGQLTWILEYLPRRNIELRFVLDDVNDKAYEFRHALSLSRPARRLTATSSAPRRDVRVATVEFTGELGVPEAELRNRLSLNVGDRFDFYRWQQDRDELERFYAGRDYLQARVRPQRIEETADTIALTFEVVRGPLSVLTIEGRALPDDVVSRMRETWTRAVFDGFLLDELQALAREHLVNDGFLRSELEIEVQDQRDLGRKEIVLRISEGPRTDERQIAFRGNERLGPDALQTFILRRGVDVTAWVDPEPLTRTLVALYQSEGMLDTQITVEPPEFQGSIATLPVRVIEGPVYTISSISVEGVETRPREVVEALIRPQPGDVYAGIGLTGARGRIDRNYRQAGFNAVRVSVQSTVDRDTSTVSVTFDVVEGPQQIIQEIEFVGGERTRTSLVTRALRISPGQPVDLGAWNRARRRLYETGAFRSVDIEAEPLDAASSDAEAGQQPVRATVVLEEWPTYRLRYGLQLQDQEVPLGDQTEQSFHLGLVGDLTRQNFVGRAITLGTAFRWDTTNRIVRGFARIPSFFGLPITSNVFLAQEHETFGDQDFLTTADLSRLTLEQRLRPRPTMTLAYSYNFDRNHTFDPSPDPNDPFGGFDETVNIARLSAGVIIDSRDDLFNASRGWFHSSSVEYGPELLGSQLRFAKYTGQQFHYWSVAGGVVLASAARVGVAAGFNQDLIPSERFFSGGGNTIRGYRQDSLGPISFFGRPQGGNASVVLNQEVRFPIFGIVRGVGFLDAGNVFPLFEDFSMSDLRVGAGVGLRFDTPFGLFRLDFAAPLSEVDDDLKSRFFFSIGQVF